MNLQVAGKTYKGVNLTLRSEATIKERQLDGFSVRDGAGRDYVLSKRGLVDRDRLDWSLPVGSPVKIDGKPYTTTSKPVDWGDTVTGRLLRIPGTIWELIKLSFGR